MREKLRQFGGQEWRKEKPTIYRVPHWIRKGHEDAYEPRIVSIGPYHHNNPRLATMEEHKWRYLLDFLSRNCIDLEDCIREMKASEEKARNSYSETVCLMKDFKTSEEQARSMETTRLPKSESDAFVEMLVLDGCFLIEFFLKFKDRRLFEDRMYIAKWVMPSVLHDMILLENQLPFFILPQLYKLTHNPNSSLLELADHCFIHWFKLKGETRPTEVFHLLHLFQLRHHPNEIQHTKKKPSPVCSQRLPTSNPPQPRVEITIPCATRLKEAGITFKKGGKKDNFLDVKFIEGVLILPPLAVEDETECRFRNLVAFEQCGPKLETFFTAYAVFMDSIINTRDDVQILEEKGIIENLLGSDKEVAKIFNTICNDVYFNVKDSYLSEFFNEVSIYCANDRNKWRAKLMHDYFSNPWSVISLAAATVLLALTLVQTVFSGISVF
ncbi:UPF0481 protein At3g47200-like [Tasmannia lanceolata]|uniref:UPF0481 protein At3g47200-like n=1 Tax=Tasmannia lanceolata TaxID=3420 RepID=UPI0040630C10